MRKFITYLTVILFVTISCGQNQNRSQNQQAQLKKRPFPTVSLPAMIQEEREMLEHMVLHFWDGITKVEAGYLCDSLHLAGVSKGDVEQNFANYTYLLDNVPLAVAQKGIARLAGLIEANESADSTSNVFEQFENIVELYLFDPNSPLRNEDYYTPFAAAMAKSAHLDPSVKDKYDYIAKMSALNAVGTKSADFRFCDIRGREHTLHGIKADYTLLFFSNPGCETCLEIINVLRDDPNINSMVEARRLAVVNVYIDEDLQAWKEYMPVYPKEWHNGFDPYLIIRADQIYNVRAIPSLYLLDKDKNVILKDAVPEKLFAYISNL